ncbi:unnamed protein product [Pleuronectes platessa]|uniref:Uncharacterized protein n=1 Tax=Pleuronectes platessa TaxID=8262 RepID=A0A9N7VJI1_PLEPL|nr:unnamed protein product [Pleuronectes platessa]
MTKANVEHRRKGGGNSGACELRWSNHVQPRAAVFREISSSYFPRPVTIQAAELEETALNCSPSGFDLSGQLKGPGLAGIVVAQMPSRLDYGRPQECSAGWSHPATSNTSPGLGPIGSAVPENTHSS